jgi:outer membrane protein assembly factor BamB
VLGQFGGKSVVLSNNVRALAGYDPATGKVLFSHDWGGDKWPKASQPVTVGEDRVFISAGYGMGCQLIKLTAGADGTFSTEEIWSGMKMKTQFNSAALRDGHLYGLDDGRLACLDVATGERLWKEGRFASGQSLLVNDLVIVQSESGPVHLCGAKPEAFTEYGKIDALSSKTWNHPVSRVGFCSCETTGRPSATNCRSCHETAAKWSPEKTLRGLDFTGPSAQLDFA